MYILHIVNLVTEGFCSSLGKFGYILRAKCHEIRKVNLFGSTETECPATFGMKSAGHSHFAVRKLLTCISSDFMLQLQ